MQGVNVKQNRSKLKDTQGKSQKQEDKEQEESNIAFTVDKEAMEITEEDSKLWDGPLKFVKTIQMLNQAETVEDRTPEEIKAIYRMREKVGRFLHQNNMKVKGDNVPLPCADFKELVKYTLCNKEKGNALKNCTKNFIS